MPDRSPVVISLLDCVAQYDAHLLKVRGLSKSTRNLHRHVVHMLLCSSFPTGDIAWSTFCFGDVVQFVSTEFQRLTSRATQRVWLMVLRSFTLSVVVYDEERTKVEHSVAEFQKLFTQHDGLLYEERYNLLNAFFATVPGNKQFNLRKQWALNSNYADLSFLFTVDSGSQWNPHLEREYLAVLESTHGTPYFLNMHCGDVAHALMLGATGSGKSFCASMLLQSAQKYDPLTFIFDLGGSYETLTRAFGGSYLNVGLKNPGFTINPFSLEPTHENMNFLYLFLRVLIEAGGRYELTPEDEKALFAAIERAYMLPAEIRTLTNFASILGPLGERLHRWTQAGQFGHLFDNPQDTLTLARFQTFNFDGWSDYPDILEPLLFYVLQRASSKIETSENVGTFKSFLIDEAWIFLKNKIIRDWIIRAEKSTLLGTLADAIPEEERILLIEDTPELHIRKPHIVSTESQVDTHRSKVTFDDLLKAVLRHRPDRIIVGEVRGPEARTLLDAMNTGHRGTLATIHAGSAGESVRRLASLAIRGSANLQLSVTEEDVTRCIDLIVYISRHQGRRRVDDVLRVQRPA